MDTLNFETAWEEQILPALEAMEEERAKAYNQRICIAVAGFCLVATGLLFEIGYFVFGLITLSILILTAFPVYYYQNSYTRNFKSHVFRALSATTQVDWQIKPRNSDKQITDDGQVVDPKTFDTSIDRQMQSNSRLRAGLSGGFGTADDVGRRLLNQSHLFADYSDFAVDDVVAGNSEGVVVIAPEIGVTKGRGRNAKTIFDGFLVKVTLGSSFQGETYIRTESDTDSDIGEDKWFGFFGSGKLGETELEWGEFEKFLEVHSSDPAEAREILTPDFMQVLYDWWKKHDKEYRIGFRDDAIYIAFPTLQRLEPRVLVGPKDQKENVKDIFAFMSFIEESVRMIRSNAM